MKFCLSNFVHFCWVRRLSGVGAVLGVTVLAGCYVVPVNQTLPAASANTVYVAPPPASMTFTARLYPANAAAAGYGMVGAVVTNDLHGRGTFSTVIQGESFAGEATRAVSSSVREGIANGAGNRGSYINCRYQMNSATQGVGQCKLSNGAQFTMHVGN